MKARTPGVNALLTLVWWALLAAVSFLSALLMYSFGEAMKKQHQRSFFISTSDLNVLPDTIDLRCLIQTYALFGIALQNFLFTAHLYLLPQVMTSDIDCVY